MIKIFSQVILLFCAFNLSAQKEPNIKLKVGIGLHQTPDATEENYWAPLYSLEPKLKTSKNTFIGLRIQATESYGTNEKYKPPQFFTDNNISQNLFGSTAQTQISFVPTFDYFFILNRFRPYLGVGVGYYMMDPFGWFQNNDLPPGFLETSVDDRVVFLIRGGIEVGKFSVGLEYNYILESDIKIPNELIIGTINESYIALTVGYSFGFRKGSK